MNIGYDRFPGGRKLALTMSYDDGVVQDRRLVDLFNRCGVKGTFHLNSGLTHLDGRVAIEEFKSLYAGHEVSVHTVHHPFLTHISRERILAEIVEDRKQLEDAVGYPVRGMSYPYGRYNEDIVSMLPAFGIEYARTVKSHHGFHLPDHFLKWEATCHHNDRLMELWNQFITQPAWYGLSLMYVWGHSYEFDRNDNWDLIEQFCESVSTQDQIWKATNIEIYDYVKALRSLQTTARGNIIRNPSAISVWISKDGEAMEIMPGQTIYL